MSRVLKFPITPAKLRQYVTRYYRSDNTWRKGIVKLPPEYFAE
jgi:hypothetical protein